MAEAPKMLAVTTVEEILREKGARKSMTVQGRTVTFFYGKASDTVYCIDTMCYHGFGGNLALGFIQLADIEDIGGSICKQPYLTCPQHHRKVLLTTGESLDFDLESKCHVGDVVQRTHRVEVRQSAQGQRVVFVEISSASSNVASDNHNVSIDCMQPLGNTTLLSSLPKSRASQVRSAAASKLKQQEQLLRGRQIQKTIPEMLNNTAHGQEASGSDSPPRDVRTKSLFGQQRRIDEMFIPIESKPVWDDPDAAQLLTDEFAMEIDD